MWLPEQALTDPDGKTRAVPSCRVWGTAQTTKMTRPDFILGRMCLTLTLSLDTRRNGASEPCGFVGRGQQQRRGKKRINRSGCVLHLITRSSQLFPFKSGQKTTMVRGSVSTYRLRSDHLETYLRTLFPGYRYFDIQLSVDGKEFYTFETPKALTRGQVEYIDEYVRLNSDDADFLGG
ncbi:uncharacterized protein B0H64DRAFT_412333 [Chaetomium fimeti]|uniref:Uncharacterized protein n=1 Tax=Chaetomium fimeti TaxID=1854472 RepID=A0AAE0LM32_9PEZI|nr:hypothetical protein B0H64DRAFT_412333 [Chaetomium fimeti]